jgi:GNAT superfamily N-acetyltransferase
MIVEQERYIQIEYTYLVPSGADSDSLGWAKVVRGETGVLWLTAVWVHPDRRGHGWATALLRTVVREWGCEPLYLRVEPYTDRPLNAAALTAFYGRFGFVETCVPGVLRREPK